MPMPADVAVRDIVAVLDQQRLERRAKLVRDAIADLATMPTINAEERQALELLTHHGSDWTLAKLGRMVR